MNGISPNPKSPTAGPAAVKILIALVLVQALILGGCNLPFGGGSSAPPTSVDQPTQDLVLLATLTQQAVAKGSEVPADTAVPETAIPSPTSSPEPTATEGEPPSSLPREIKFRPGGTMAILEGEITAGEQIAFTFDAAANQTLIATVSSNDQEVVFEVKGLDVGGVLASFSEKATSLTAPLPATQTYQVTLSSPTDNVYFLSLEIPANLNVITGIGPATVTGIVNVLEDIYPRAQTRVRYQLHLDAGETLDVILSSNALEDLTLALTGQSDGVPYLRPVVKSESINDFAVTVSQNYYLDVYAVSENSAEYTMKVEVTE